MNEPAWQESDAWRVFRMPLLLALLSMAGLAAALCGAGPWRWLSWAALGTLVILCLWYLLRSALANSG